MRDRLAIAIVAVALALGLGSLAFVPYDPGIHLAVRDGRIVVSDVAPFSQAERDGVRPGLIAVTINQTTLIRLPATVYGSPDPNSPDPRALPILGVDPASPVSANLSTSDLVALASARIDSIDLLDPGQLAGGSLASGSPDGYITQGFYYSGSWQQGEAALALLPGLALLLLAAWWLTSGRGGESLRTLALPLAAAISVSFFVQPLAATGPAAPVAVAGLLSVAAMIPLAFGLAERIGREEERRVVVAGVAVLAAAAALAVVGYAVSDPASSRPSMATLSWALTGAIPLIAGLVAAGPLQAAERRVRAGRGPGALLQSTELAIAGATPMFALATDRGPYLWPLAVWLVAIGLAGRFTVRPLARLATRAALQRDLVVAATEAERARVAADIHDDALQELTLLVRRLENAGDAEGAEMGRTVADRLRAICGDLRLPILDDLGVGPALDWLVLRIERLAGGEVRLERADEARHGADVELAIFRVAQEALANAVKHGRPPIVVRYHSTPNGISLAIDDAGPGIAETAPAEAEQAGRFGLLNMAQRAEQIGAILDVRRWPGGGTHVALEWRSR